MTADLVNQLAREALWAVLWISAPLLIGSLASGLLVSIFQATTQIQEATLAFIPKIVVVLVIMIFFGPWMLQSMLEYAIGILGELQRFAVIR
ncbi:flagellar biosynthesis protein FliQ [Heliophilum fasciatum]|uniref:Flagellar biosynthetic protein FliQ n=1 Tax=Heliophilum fasciatum TaxID=35700 RepID=A0A4R2RKR7_9FIRM|nr:flagellar biosynthesis protein FliQ [Heliophilum fasciatum]MCW2277928.1 flagellar biosynthetic protein FliQ [Heliophilum fasciatum]TCP64502.1 flagellar biosynthetic protein FliQ [Heliophilum fasciatum]